MHGDSSTVGDDVEKYPRLRKGSNWTLFQDVNGTFSPNRKKPGPAHGADPGRSFTLSSESTRHQDSVTKITLEAEMFEFVSTSDSGMGKQSERELR